MFERFRSLVVFGAVAFSAACSGPSSSSDPAPVATAIPSAGAPDAMTGPTILDDLPVVAAADDPAAVAPAPQVPAGASLTGEQVVEYVCSQCHSMDPPPLKAPPLTHLAQHLRESFTSVDDAVTHVVSFAPSPDAETSILPATAQERFGLMPPQPLPAPMLEAAARYIWSLSDGTEPEMGNGGMGRAGTGRGGMANGMMHRGGQMDPDSTLPARPRRGMNRSGGG
jgi:cytochrome c5